MYENCSLIFTYYHIRLPWQFFIMQPESEPMCKQIPPHHHLRLRILAFDAAHVVTPGEGIVHVGHDVKESVCKVILLSSRNSATHQN